MVTFQYRLFNTYLIHVLYMAIIPDWYLVRSDL